MRSVNKMSLPKFPDINQIPTIDQALSAIVTSVAMEEVALSKLITAESEKVKAVTAFGNADDIIAVNNSVASTMDKIAELQKILKEKLAIATSYLPPSPEPQPDPPDPPVPSCISIFKTENPYTWYDDRSLQLVEDKKCDNGLQMICRKCDAIIILPSGKEMEMQFDLNAKSRSNCQAYIDFKFYKEGLLVKQKRLLTKSVKGKIQASRMISYQTPAGGEENYLKISLVSPQQLNYVSAKLSVEVIEE